MRDANPSPSGALIPGILKTDSLKPVLRFYEILLAILVAAGLVVLAIRSGVRLEDRWDTFMYHLPFAALRGGLDIPFEMNERLLLAYQGFPPLAHWVQGWLWRLTGSVNATGVVNILAFLTFLGVVWRLHRASFGIVAAVALTAPMVLIHTTVSYVDLFGNAWLALGVVSLFYAYYCDRKDDRFVLIAGLAGLVLAAWTKFQLTPLVAFFLLLYLLAYRSMAFNAVSRFDRAWIWILVGGFLAALPYLFNWVSYGNPYWPVPLPVFKEWFPYSLRFDPELSSSQVPPQLMDASQIELFFRSLFEVGHPHEYEHRARWIIDQGNASLAFRSGGLWNVSVVIFLALSALLLFLLNLKKGLVVVLVGIASILFLSILPASHEMRYYLFLPLSWAGILGLLYSQLRHQSAVLALAVLWTVTGLFLYASSINRNYYAIERLGYAEVASNSGMDYWWSRLNSDETFCAANMVPVGLMLTGPTMSEFNIIDRSYAALCPEDSVILHYESRSESHELMMAGALRAMERADYDRAIEILDLVLSFQPDHFGALWQQAQALESAHRIPEAISAWQAVLDEANAKGYSDTESIRLRLSKLKSKP